MNNKSIKIIVFLFAFGISGMYVNAQSASGSGASTNNKKLFTAFGFSPLLSVFNGPSNSFVTYDSPTNPVTQTASYFTFDYFDLIFRIRYNLTEFSNNSSLSVSALPAIGIGISGGLSSSSSQTGFGTLNIPIVLEYNLGNVATYTADQEKGFVCGAGIEFNDAPLFGASGAQYSDINGNTQTVPLVSSWVQPVVELGYRYWNKRNKAKEFNLKFGFGSGGAFTARLSWFAYIGY